MFYFETVREKYEKHQTCFIYRILIIKSQFKNDNAFKKINVLYLNSLLET